MQHLYVQKGAGYAKLDDAEVAKKFIKAHDLAPGLWLVNLSSASRQFVHVSKLAEIPKNPKLYVNLMMYKEQVAAAVSQFMHKYPKAVPIEIAEEALRCVNEHLGIVYGDAEPIRDERKIDIHL